MPPGPAPRAAGTTFLCVDLATGEQVAIKALDKHHPEFDMGLALDELAILATISDHPNVASLIGAAPAAVAWCGGWAGIQLAGAAGVTGWHQGAAAWGDSMAAAQAAQRPCKALLPGSVQAPPRQPAAAAAASACVQLPPLSPALCPAWGGGGAGVRPAGCGGCPRGAAVLETEPWTRLVPNRSWQHDCCCHDPAPPLNNSWQ